METVILMINKYSGDEVNKMVNCLLKTMARVYFWCHVPLNNQQWQGNQTEQNNMEVITNFSKKNSFIHFATYNE